MPFNIFNTTLLHLEVTSIAMASSENVSGHLGSVHLSLMSRHDVPMISIEHHIRCHVIRNLLHSLFVNDKNSAKHQFYLFQITCVILHIT